MIPSHGNGKAVAQCGSNPDHSETLQWPRLLACLARHEQLRLNQECEYFIKFNLVVSADRGANISSTVSAF
jgi:hypothetical protein